MWVPTAGKQIKSVKRAEELLEISTNGLPYLKHITQLCWDGMTIMLSPL